MYHLLHADSFFLGLSSDSVDTIVTDPPYGYEFMGKNWDHGVPGVRFWREALRVAKPGAMLLAFGGTRTHHRLMVAIEDAGWELRDVIMWVYGSGYPKSYDISKGMDKAAGADREVVGHDPSKYRRDNDNNNTYAAHCGQTGDITAPATPEAQTWDGWGTALKPAWEPIIVAMAPRDGTYVENALKYGVAGLWIDGARVPTEDDLNGGTYGGVFGNGKPTRDKPIGSGRWPSNLIHDGSDEAVELFPATNDDEGSAARSSRPRPRAREVSADRRYHELGSTYLAPLPGRRRPPADTPARFFYAAKASRAERDAGLAALPKRVGGGMAGTADKSLKTGSGNERNNRVRNHHPTVKPLSLMRYLVRMTRTPTGGVVLDPFVGSGTTGMACMYEGRDFIGVDINAGYVQIAEARIRHAERAAERGLLVEDLPAERPDDPFDDLPLFNSQ